MRKLLCGSLFLALALQVQGVTVLLRDESSEGACVLSAFNAAASFGESPEARWARANLRLLNRSQEVAGGVADVSNVVRVAAADAAGIRHVFLDRPDTWDLQCAWKDITREYARLCAVDGGEGGDLEKSGARLFIAVVHALWGSPGDRRLNAADPHVLQQGGRYYLYGTTSSSKGFIAYVSDDLRKWTRAKGRARDGMVFARGDGFGDRQFWAPEVHAYKGRFYLFYSANRCCCVAVADSPLGPFRNPTMKPIFAQSGKQAIDNSLFIDEDGTPWMPFSLDERFALVRLKPDLMSIVPDSLSHPFDEPRELWQKGTEEGPSIVRIEGKYVVLFSGDGCESQDYAVGVGYSDRMTGPWKRLRGYRFLHRAGGLTGTGHGSPFQAADGSWHYVFHAHETPAIMGKRRTYTVSMVFEDFVPRMSEGPVSCVLEEGI